MKHHVYSILLLILTFAVHNNYVHAEGIFRLSKKDKQEIGDIMREPIEQINKAIGQLNAYANQVQVINNDVNVHADINVIKDHSHKILKELEEINAKLDQAFQQIAILRILVGNPDDPSVDPAIFDSVQAIDDAKLPIYQWLKTITRAIIEGNIVS